MEIHSGGPGRDANDAPAADVSRCNGNVARACEWDGCAPLTGRQKRFASDRCRTAHYEHNHPRLGLPPVIPEGRSLDRLVALCADGRYRTIPEMAHETGTREATVARRIQESQSGRKGRALARFTWDVRVRAHSKAKEYRLVLGRPHEHHFVTDEDGVVWHCACGEPYRG